MLQLQPGEKFIIVRGIEDHSDSGTYYVRAVVRNAESDAIIGTVNLSDKGDGHRFSAEWYVPQDPGGSGLYIVITTSVYTDAGYTTKSGNYGDKYDTYLIQKRLTRNDIPFGGTDISYKKVEEIVKRVVDQRKPQAIPKVNLENVQNQLSRINDFLSAFKIPESEKFDYEKILTELATLKNEMADLFKAIPTPEKIDLNPVLEEVNKNNESTNRDIQEAIANLIEIIKKNAEKTASAINEYGKKFNEDSVIELKGIVRPIMPKEDKKKVNKNRPFLNI